MEARPPEAAPRPEPAGALAAGCEEGETRTLLAIRVDGLADLRARFGDVTGQRALREVARAIRHALRERDTFERCHADRFVAVLPGVDAATAAEVAGRLQRAVSSLTVVTHGGDEVHLSAAVGRACAPADGATVEELREVADRDLDRPADGVPMPQADAAQRLRRALPLLPN
jgi:diguanylate cyclase (GGDEF)-like protein